MKTKFLAIALSATVLVAASGTGTVTAAAQERDAVNIAMTERPADIDLLHMKQSSSSAEVLFNMTYDSLIGIDANGRLMPELAKELEISESDSEDGSGGYQMHFEWVDLDPASDWIDGVPWEGAWEEGVSLGDGDLQFLDGEGSLWMKFVLREGICFQDGTPLDAYSVANLIDYARLQSRDTVVYRQWQPVTNYIIEDDYTITLYLFFGCSEVVPVEEEIACGYIDFLYNLASPRGSIVQTQSYDGFALGTGAYVLKADGGSRIELESNPYWWGKPVSTQYVNFLYGEISLDNVDLGIFQQDPSNGLDTVVSVLTNNPVAITFANGVFNDEHFRKAVAYSIDKYSLNWLSEAPGIWIRDARLYGIPEAQNQFNNFVNETAMEYDDGHPVVVKMLVPQDGELIRAAETVVHRGLEKIGVELRICMVDKASLYSEWQDGNYDMMLAEIELTNVNSAINMLYSKISDNADGALHDSKFAANLYTYYYVHASAQNECVNNATLVNLGWQPYYLVQNSNVSGVELPQKSCSTGMLGRLDFRWVKVDE